MPEDRNVLGEKLDTCSIRPMIGFYRTGCCETGAEDAGAHVVCVLRQERLAPFANIEHDGSGFEEDEAGVEVTK
jgi:uncharacterized protein (DUF2237 family)